MVTRSPSTPSGRLLRTQRLPLASSQADPAVAIGVGDGQRLQAHLQADHLHQAAAEHVRRVAAGAAVLGDGHAGAGVAVGHVVAGAARVDVAAVHHLGDAVGQEDAVELAGVAVNAVALAEVALRQAPAPLVAEPGIHLLKVHRAARRAGSVVWTTRQRGFLIDRPLRSRGVSIG